MAPSPDRGLSHRGVLHEYAPRLVAFEFTQPASVNKPNSLIFVGGLTDGFCTVPYVSKLAEALEPTDWSVFSILLSSSYNGFGVGSLDKDVEEIGHCVRYIRDLKASRQPGAPSKSAKIVVMGHSTGSQDVLHYIHAPNPLPKPEFDIGLEHIVRPELDGAIMQAPVSDREAVLAIMKSATNPSEVRGAFDQLVSSAKKQPWTEEGNDTLLPMNMTAKLGLPGDAPLSARRFLSLTSPDSPASPSQDDLFSSDLSDKRHQETFGAVGSRGILQSKLLALYSGSDEWCPAWVDKEKLMQRWKQALEAGGASWAEQSGIVPGASHNVRDEGQRDLIDRVLGYLESI
ncbi:hypothetical protein N7509_008925 [Penicillium cosmopolitanum]|uniref:Uncharacterized protein n=1 Tax=Penicillium cosmopolitanum TaxID=1131564 RepID=A0A9W9VNJ7_9EURO|nr:uncharacterized protein N7509_008925 [Penicillium cosmopolitanum]KAJ5386384.1 hypothetical protein N7509_008925 [Penicillium cosmopolitanum]